MNESDYKEIMKRWKQDSEKARIWRQPKHRVMSEIAEVSVRPPSVYDVICNQDECEVTS